MEAKNLRIGNYILNGAGKVITVSSETIIDIILKHIGAEPILLSEEWLLCLGFEKVEDLGDMISYEIKSSKRRGFGVKYDHEEWVFYLYAGNTYTTLIYDEPYFQYVHQLQNAYFSLTGIELSDTKN